MVNTDQTDELIRIFSSLISDVDLVIVVDFGHGFISSPFIEEISRSGIFTAVNTQTNAGNRGFNVISRYPRVEYVCLNATELNLEERTNSGDIKSKILNVSDRISADKILITEGKFGTTFYDKTERFIRTPAFAGKVIDRIGAGDAIISITAGLAYLNAPADIIGFVANAVASMAVSTVGHRSSIEPVGLYKYITTLLK
jgi:bifunctional ADP-heptose synthase (sugar kinase/adenylyltransferase)